MKRDGETYYEFVKETNPKMIGSEIIDFVDSLRNELKFIKSISKYGFAFDGKKVEEDVTEQLPVEAKSNNEVVSEIVGEDENQLIDLIGVYGEIKLISYLAESQQSKDDWNRMHDSE